MAAPAPIIYASKRGPIPEETIPACSAFSFLFPSAANGAPADPYPASAPAFIDAPSGLTLTRGDMRRHALALGWGLTHPAPRRPGVLLARGDTVLLVCPNALAFPLALYGAAAAGLVVSPANSAYTPHELRFQYEDARAKIVLAHPALVPAVRAMFREMDVGPAEMRARIVVADWAGIGAKGLDDKGRKELRGLVGIEELMSRGSLEHEELFTGDQVNEVAYLCYSSGTTGKPKGVMTTHRNIISNTRQIQEDLGYIKYGEDVHLGVLPLFHIYGLNNLVHHAFSIGVPVVLMARFDFVPFLRAIAQHRVTLVLVVPPIALALVHSPETEKHDLRSLRRLISGAAPLGAPLVTAVEEKMRRQGADCTLTQGYGLTEASPTSIVLPPPDSMRKVGSVGFLVRSLEARLVADDGADAPRGGPGEVWLRGPNIMKGYWNNDEATRDSITPDGWLKTGDVATVDEDGYFYVVDRKKELIKYKGFQVPPAELESVLLQHPQIVDAAVIGVESAEEATELPRAYIVLAKKLPNAAAERALAREVEAWVRTRVAQHKFLRGGVSVIPAVPKTASGKILRKDLRELAAQERAAEAGAPARAKL